MNTPDEMKFFFNNLTVYTGAYLDKLQMQKADVKLHMSGFTNGTFWFMRLIIIDPAYEKPLVCSGRAQAFHRLMGQLENYMNNSGLDYVFVDTIISNVDFAIECGETIKWLTDEEIKQALPKLFKKHEKKKADLGLYIFLPSKIKRPLRRIKA